MSVASFDATVSSFSTSSSSIDLGVEMMDNVFLEVPSMASNTAVFIQGSGDGSTFRRVKHHSTTGGSDNDFTVISSITNSMIPIPNGLRYLKLETDVVISFTASYKIIASRS